jgi:hypothetical protein
MLPAAQKISIVSIANGLGAADIPAKRLEESDLVQKRNNEWVVLAGLEREWIQEYSDQLLDSAGQELWATHAKEVDLSRLADELIKLTKQNLVSSEALLNLKAAIREAQKGNGAKVYKYLGKVGAWILDAATLIGADVAASVIRHTYGLP